MNIEIITDSKIDKNTELLITSLIGILIFIVTTSILELIIKPLIKYRNTKIEIKGLIKYYKDRICNPIGHDISLINTNNYIRYQEVSNEIRKLACNLEISYYSNLNFFRTWPLIKESKEDISESYSQLIGISNNLIQTNLNRDNDRYIEVLEKKLKIKINE